MQDFYLAAGIRLVLYRLSRRDGYQLVVAFRSPVSPTILVSPSFNESLPYFPLSRPRLMGNDGGRAHPKKIFHDSY